MIKISNNEIIDVVRYSDTKMIFAEKMLSSDLTRYKNKFFILDFNTGEKEVVTTTVYKLKKFGYAYEKICEKITSFVECDAFILKNKNVLVMFDGEAGLFDRDGEMLWQRSLSYNDSPVTSLAPETDYFWTVCKNEDCAIRYNADNFNIDIRVGGKGKGTFNKPYFASADGSFVYVCCSDRIRKISMDNLVVSDVEGVYEIPKRFYKLGRYSIFCKTDGVYLDKDE
ncbi:MAG: hypothetical protein IKF64_07535 [Eubacterium sp.]|nr:hypothetical protein [Eubacterium sp.]